jgi:hypothetical protein
MVTTVDIFNEEHTEDNSDICSICRQQFETNDILRTLNRCNHRFHRNCIDRWFEEHITCPFCRHDIRNNTEDNADNNTTDNADNTTDNADNNTTDNVEETVSIERVTIPITESLNEIISTFIANNNNRNNHTDETN